MTLRTDDLRIASIEPVASPAVLLKDLPITEQAAAVIHRTRDSIHHILRGDDDRLLVITGPCSIHDIHAAKEYASRLKGLVEQYQDTLLLVMRVYFEKPRTTIGWKGLINDPGLDGSFNINQGLHMARQLLLELNQMGIPAGTEYLDLITPQYVSDLISWGAIGARTTESQVHRELASGLSCPVGFKNGTDGTTKIAVDAVNVAARPHHFLSLQKVGTAAIFATRGNPDCHIILRGGNDAPNYDQDSLEKTVQLLESAGLLPRLMIDFSHANSKKLFERQLEVGREIAERISNGDQWIFGVMIESHLVAGQQSVTPGRPLVYGQSITDACLGWEDTEQLIARLADAVRQRRDKK